MNKGLRVLALVLLLAMAASGQRAAPRVQKATYSISGWVVDAGTGEPIANAEIYLGVASQETAQEAMLSSPMGRFSFSGLAAGKYVVLAGKRGFVTQTYGGREDYSIAVAVGPGMEPEVTFRLQAEGSIAGVVRSSDDMPIRGAEVSLFRNDLSDGLRRTFKTADATSDEEGGYRFRHLSPGEYYLAVTAQTEFSGYLQSAFSLAAVRYTFEASPAANAEASQDPVPPELDVAYPITFFPEALTPGEAQGLVLHAGGRLQADFRLRPVHAIHMKIPAGASVALQQKAFEDGEWQINAALIASETPEWKTLTLAPGVYSMAMDMCGQEGCVSGGSELELTADTTIDPDRVVGHAVKISGTASMDDGSPVTPGKMIGLIPPDSVSVTQRIWLPVEEGGKLDASAPMPSKRYTVELGDSALSIKSMAVDGARVRGRTIELSGGDPLRLALVLTRGSIQVRGKVVSGGSPVAGAMVLLVPEDFENNAPLFRRDESDSDGTFAVRPAPPGNYIAVALQDGWDIEWARPEVLKPYLVKGKPIRLASGATADIVLELQ